MGRNSTSLDCEKMGEVREEITNKSKHTKKNQFGLNNFREDRYSCISRCKFAWKTYSSICSHTTAIWNQTTINCKQIKIIKEAANNTKTGICGSTDGNKFSRQHSKVLAKL